MVRRVDRETYQKPRTCERCGEKAHRLGPDGWCVLCADRLRASEEESKEESK